MDVLKAMEADAGIAVQELRVDGGATVNNLLMQFQSDILGIDVIRPKVTETTALGAAYLAGLTVGYWSGVQDVQGQWQLDQRFKANMAQGEVARRVSGWQRAVRSAIAWAEA
jgi:glycerol kinase